MGDTRRLSRKQLSHFKNLGRDLVEGIDSYMERQAVYYSNYLFLVACSFDARESTPCYQPLAGLLRAATQPVRGGISSMIQPLGVLDSSLLGEKYDIMLKRAHDYIVFD